jgi:hypothetical protein
VAVFELPRLSVNTLYWAEIVKSDPYIVARFVSMLLEDHNNDIFLFFFLIFKKIVVFLLSGLDVLMFFVFYVDKFGGHTIRYDRI